MHAIFSITTKDIQKLTDEQSRELVARLCRAELSKNSISQAAVTWGGDQRAKDGGVDVRVDIDPPAGIGGYIKSDRCAFQVKAEHFRPGKIPREMAPEGVLRPAIEELAKSDGAYIIASTRDNLSGSSLPNRVKAMAACLADHGLAGKVRVDFYDCRKIADWVEQHPAIAIWVRHVLGKPLVGWQPYLPWAYQETDIKAEYLVDDRVKIFVPNADEGSNAQSAINHLRGDLSKNVSVRIVGLSGVGKTRLVQALFDKRVCTELPALDAENVLYTDLSDNPTPQPSAMIEALTSDDSDCVVIVDNCGQDVHQRLTEMAKRPRSKLRLVTIEYDIRDDLPEGTVCYRLEGSSGDLIKELLKRRFKVLSDTDLNKIAEFSDGNARVAYALASTTETTGELARLRDSELFERLFRQKNAESGELLRCAETVSLLYSFDREDISASSEMAILASLADVSVVSLAWNVAELQRRGLVQQRGKWCAVLPHAISNRLATNAIEALPRDLLIKVLIENASDRVARSFSRRLGYLHESQTAREVVQRWLEPNGRYGDLASLNEIGRQIFTNIAPVHQEAALDCLQRATQSLGFVSKDNRQYVLITRALAYEPKLFDRAADVLVRFAIAEPEGNNYNSTRDVLKSLFYCHLSGTEAQSDQRSKVVQDLLLSNDDGRQKLGFLLLKSALEAWNFTSSYDFDFGARKRGFGWWPRTDDEVRAWYQPFIDIDVAIGKNDPAQGREARALLGESVRGLWVEARLSNEITAAARDLAVIDGWPEGWLGARQILQWDKDKLDEESFQELRKLEYELAPRDLKAKIDVKVLARGSFAYDLDVDIDDTKDFASRYRRTEQEAENLGKAAALDNELVSELLPDLLHNSTNGKVWHFGFGVGQETQDTGKLLAQARHIVESPAPGSVNLIFLRGFISGWHKVRPEEVSAFFDEALYDEVWGKWFPELQLRVDLDDVGYKRLLTSLELGMTPILQYQYLAVGRVTDPLTVAQISTLVDAIAAESDDGLLVSIEVLKMVILCAKEKDDDYRSELARACIAFLRSLDWARIQDDLRSIDHEMDVILEFALTHFKNEHEISEILHSLVAYERSRTGSHSYGRSKLLAPFFQLYPKQTLDAVYVADSDGQYRTAYEIVSDFDRNQRVTTIRDVPVNTLIEWCDISPDDRYIFAAQICHLFEKDHEATGGLVFSEAAIRVLAGASDKRAVLHIFIDHFCPTRWSGSLAAILKERLPLLAQLNPDGDEALRIKIAEVEETIRKRIAAEEAFEEDRERARTGSFE